jgi:predicted MFS family arabinose efflux permease
MKSPSTNAKYSLWMLMAVYTFSFLDRQIISILAQDIKMDLKLTDSELGMLTGLAFAIFYATLGLPIARLADKYNRISIIAICLSIWSLMTVISGMASNYLQLALARMGVGIGEAGALPCSHSIIADTFPPEKRSSAMAIFQLGVPAGILFGFLIGGWVNQWVGWRWALVLVGAPGVLLAILLYFTVKEPIRNNFSVSDKTKESEIGFWEQITELLSNRIYIYIGVAATLASMGGYCIMAWVPSLLIREYQLSTGVLGTLLSLIIGIGGGLGTYYAGKLGDKSASKSANGPLWLCMWINLLTAPLFLIGFLATDLISSLVFLTPAYIIYLAWMGPNWAMVQAVSPSKTRAMASALVLLVINLVGLGLGPLLVGIVSDYLNGQGVSRSLNWALISSLIVYPLAALFYGLAAKAYGNELNSTTESLES